ncbi:aminopeptidase [Oleiharenicola lentus]|jgi:aminopeptidase|uniref:Aminopeptidase n=1 Tax=Oleiharenicola lentus TaxID=2508720 RepID=A0A4Q1CCP7_9BACT|nr:aminopeptidase [Oleiharenicola lentus]RXK56692.1 aminopeptidase [Oleiharenicola lentus]
MPPPTDQCLQTLAQLVVRVGLNLQPGQPLLITDPYDLQGAHRGNAPLIEAIRAAAPGHPVEVIAADVDRLRYLVTTDHLRGFEKLVETNARRMKEHLAAGGAFLFLPGTHPRLLADQPAERLTQFDSLKWRHLAPLIRKLIRGATQWTLLPAPTQDWADLASPELPATERLPALWATVFQALRITTGNNGSTECRPTEAVIADWQSHLAALTRRRDELNAARHRRIRYIGMGTELTLKLPRSHAWCTARLVSKRGVPFVVNLPTEEVFTAPNRYSATGRIRLARPIAYGGAVIEGVELEFRRGRVTLATARANSDLLQRLLSTDDGADRIGEVALVPGRTGLVWGNRFHHHILLDENTTPHIALGDAYCFCTRSWVPPCFNLCVNSSQLHIDLPLDATVSLD